MFLKKTLTLKLQTEKLIKELCITLISGTFQLDVFYGVTVNIFNMIGIISVITNQMFPIPTLPSNTLHVQ